MVSLPRIFTNYDIKLLAAVLMVIDHVGDIFFPQCMIFRQIGRLSLPLFVWLLVQGERHTHNVVLYGARLLVLGVLSQPIYELAFNLQPYHDFNILFTLFIGLVCLRLARMFPRIMLLIWIAGAMVARFLAVDYGSYGIAVIAFGSRFKPTAPWWLCWLGLHAMILYAIPGYGSIQGFATIAPVFFHMTNHEVGAKARWFYAFYPAHLLVLYLIRQWTNTL
ncbi:MAG: TraX family protein [Synechococcales cyanobacterium K44_A2020_017]|jgi:hypothetical protein|uniref:TraX family protein n=1 Tax=Leptolyngbya sp. CCY15150 TaxID=2767772 RepID=UPI00195224E2|nr:TraX family protein [Leptolyngbya sp. CCY15150]MBF2089366.1 TraX family protein [Synechococcales cyanobacterium K32_A2020_035]MBF2095511.1 TraX family protein [Synechococcales cyanobacterium K44_A2020_017]